MRIEANKEHLGHLNQKLKNQITVKEQEIDNIKKFYDHKMDNTKAEQKNDFLIQRDANEQRLGKLINQRQEQLDKTKKNIAETNQMLEKQKQQIELKHDKELEHASLDQNLKLENKYRQGLDEAKDINQRTNQTVEKMQQEYRDRMQAIEHQTKQHILQAQAKSKREKLEASRKFDNTAQAVTHNHNQNLKLETEKELQKSLDEMKERYSELEKDYEQSHQSELKLHAHQKTNDLERSQENFDVRYNNMLKEHQELFKTTKDKLESEFKDLIDQHTELRENYTNKIDDEFYRPQELSPKVQDLGNAYQVDIEVPEYEKENVRVSPQDRTITVSLNRRYQQRVDAESGGFQKTSRTELLSQTVKTPEILDSSKITQKYEDGVLSFKIQKA